MTPQAARFFEKARELLAQAPMMLQVGLHDACGRNVYLAAFHAAQAFIFEADGRTPKTHSGVRTVFFRLTKDDPRLDGNMRNFLARSYNLKTTADYETTPGARVTAAIAAQALEEGRAFVSSIANMLDVATGRPSD